jgi:hypothetical protein
MSSQDVEKRQELRQEVERLKKAEKGFKWFMIIFFGICPALAIGGLIIALSLGWQPTPEPQPHEMTIEELREKVNHPGCDQFAKREAEKVAAPSPFGGVYVDPEYRDTAAALGRALHRCQ